MCEICTKVQHFDNYKNFINKMIDEDKKRLEFTKEKAKELATITKLLYTSVKWPVKLIYPMFEARTAYCVPNNYFQSLYIDGERCGAMFAHGSMRSLFFVEDKIILFSKTVHHAEGNEFFTSFILADFDRKEFKYYFDGENFAIIVDKEKKMKNLITGRIDAKKIKFNFINNSVKNRIMLKENVLTSTQFKAIYEKYGTAVKKVASIDLEGYAITVPHFSPHPYLLQIHKELGFASSRDFQEHVVDYFRTHLNLFSKNEYPNSL